MLVFPIVDFKVLLKERGHVNRPFPSLCLTPLQSESNCKVKDAILAGANTTKITVLKCMGF